jgi:hypothetical protein
MHIRASNIVVLLLALATAACSKTDANITAPAASTVPAVGNSASACEDRAADSYKGALLRAISMAERIVVSEHSDRYDGMAQYVDGQPEPQWRSIITYNKREMNANQKNAFLARISAMPAFDEEIVTACIFQPRHTIEFYTGGKMSSAMRICFQCGQSEWDGSKKIAPRYIYAPLEAVVKEMGFSPERDWHNLRLAHKIP